MQGQFGKLFSGMLFSQGKRAWCKSKGHSTGEFRHGVVPCEKGLGETLLWNTGRSTVSTCKFCNNVISSFFFSAPSRKTKFKFTAEPVGIRKKRIYDSKL